MRKTLLILLIAAGFSACGTSSSSSLSSPAGSGSFLSSTVQLDQQFVYALSADQSQLLAYEISGEDEGGGHDHEHGHVHAQHDHEHDHGDGGSAGLELVELDGSPYTLPGGEALSLVVVAEGRSLVVLFTDGTLRNYSINGVTGLLGEPTSLPSRVDNPRKLRLSPEGDAIAVLGDDLALFPVEANGELAPLPAIVTHTQDWSDVALGHHGGAGATAQGAVGFSWERGGPVSTSSEVILPGTTRGGLALAHDEVFVTNTEDQTVSQLSQNEETGQLTLVETFELPEVIEDPSAIAVLFDGEDLLVGGTEAVVLLHHHEDELEEEGHAELDQTPSDFFSILDTGFVLVAHAEGEGFHLLKVGEGLSVVSEFEEELANVTSFGLARRIETVTVTEEL